MCPIGPQGLFPLKMYLMKKGLSEFVYSTKAHGKQLKLKKNVL